MAKHYVVFSYGGGRQTVAMLILIDRGIIPKPDLSVMADTGRENPCTWEYLETYSRPLLKSLDIPFIRAGHELAKVDLYALNGDLLLPVFTKDAKLPAFCSNEWKARVCDRALAKLSGGSKWLGYAFDERKRWRKALANKPGKWKTECPLVDLMLTTANCLQIITDYGWPLPEQSSCYMCPHKQNSEWRMIRDKYPEEFEKACVIDEETRENDDQGGVFLHYSRVPLREADLTVEETQKTIRQCSLGMCFV